MGLKLRITLILRDIDLELRNSINAPELIYNIRTTFTLVSFSSAQENTVDV